MSRPPENPPIPFKRPSHPTHDCQTVVPFKPNRDDGPAYAELHALTNFSFLRGASHPGEMVIQAKLLGHTAIGIADVNTLAGVVRAHAQAKKEGLKLLIGATLEFTGGVADGLSCVCYPTDRAAYGRLCKLLSDGKRRAPKGACHIRLEDVLVHAEGQVFIALPPVDMARHAETFPRMVEALATIGSSGSSESGRPAGVWLGVQRLFRGDDRLRNRAVASIAQRFGLPTVALNSALYHSLQRRRLQDVVTCIREKCTLQEAGFRLQANAERHLKSGAEMARLFADDPLAMAATQQIAGLCTFNLDELRYNYPNEPVPPEKTAQGHLTDLVYAGLRERFSSRIPDKVQAYIDKELGLIEELGYAHYFLTVHDIVAWARGQGILCQGRGSAANSAVCYYLNITSVNPEESSLLFERFLSRERKEPPDIDVDFEHARREEVMQYIYRRYGRHRAAIAATVITYRPRSAMREVGKVMGLSEDITSKLASTVWGSWGTEIFKDQVIEAGLDPNDALLAATLALSHELLGFPRHLSQHVGGYVLTEDPLEELVPIGNAAMDERTFIEWDKDDIDVLGILKVDVLALGMLTCIAKCFAMIKQHYHLDVTLANIEKEDQSVYAMLQRADAIGVFQVESRAQMNMLPRLKPTTFYDLVIEVAIVRPGPIQGDMVHPYLRRRDGLEEVVYPYPLHFPDKKDELRNILGRTLGVPLFQEQAMQIAIDAAQFTPEEANKLRRAMATFRNVGTIHLLQDKMVSQMMERGYDPQFAANCFEQIKGFGSYGFPESHAASFAQLVYVSAWLKFYFPDVFCACLLNAQPMGFYAPAQIVRDAREHGVEVRPVDINHSDWETTLEEPLEDGRCAVRLGFRQVTGLPEEAFTAFVNRRPQHLKTPEEARRLGGLSVAMLERLASADAFRSMGLDRREALWIVRGMAGDKELPLFDAAQEDLLTREEKVALPDMPLNEHVVADYQTHRLSLKAHPLALLRPLYEQGIESPGARKTNTRRRPRTLSAVDLFKSRQNQWVTVAGVVLVRQKPGTAKGVVFITLEDETGTVNIVVWRKLLEKYRRIVMNARLLAVRGQVQREGDVIHVVAHELIDRTDDLDQLSDDTFALTFANADHVKSELPQTSSMKRKIERLAARGETAQNDVADLIAARQPPGSGSNRDLIPLSPADEVKSPQVERDGWPMAEPDSQRFVTRETSTAREYELIEPATEQDEKGRKGPAVNQGRHPRNVQIIPKSRDFH